MLEISSKRFLPINQIVSFKDVLKSDRDEGQKVHWIFQINIYEYKLCKKYTCVLTMLIECAKSTANFYHAALH